MTVKSSISLTDQQAAFARSLVDSGQYASLSSVLQQGLDLLRRKQEVEALESEALRALLERRAQGAFVSMDEMDVRLEDMIERKRNELRVDN